MTPEATTGAVGMALGYARETAGMHPLSPQIDALTEAGVDPARIYTDAADPESVSSAPPRQGLTALLDYARPGDTTVVVGIDRLGRNAPEVLATARELSGRRIGLRSLREGLDTDDPAGAMIVGVLASLAELDAEIEGQRRSTAVPRTDATSTVGRPRALDDDQIDVAERMRAAGQPVPSIAAALGVSRATLYRTLAERRSVR